MNLGGKSPAEQQKLLFQWAIIANGTIVRICTLLQRSIEAHRLAVIKMIIQMI